MFSVLTAVITESYTPKITIIIEPLIPGRIMQTAAMIPQKKNRMPVGRSISVTSPALSPASPGRKASAAMMPSMSTKGQNTLTRKPPSSERRRSIGTNPIIRPTKKKLTAIGKCSKRYVMTWLNPNKPSPIPSTIGIK